MFGIIKGFGCNMNCADKREWIGHICGLCLTLRKHHGQFSRLTTNYDAALLSVLCEAQSQRTSQKYSHLCPLRRFQRAEVVDAKNPGAQYAASISLLIAATKIDDHLVDNDNWLRYFPGFFVNISLKWTQAAHRAAKTLGFHTEVIRNQTQRQFDLEQQISPDFFSYSQPTEQAVGAAFQHTSSIAGCPQNADTLYHIGQMFGRIMYLLDSYRDYATDLAADKFNALARCFASGEIQAQTRQLFRQAHAALERLFDQLTLPNPDLARKLLIYQLKENGEQTIDNGQSTTDEATEPAEEEKKPKKRGGCFDCGDCCCCCLDGTCSCCDYGCCGSDESSGCCVDCDCCNCDCC